MLSEIIAHQAVFQLSRQKLIRCYQTQLFGLKTFLEKADLMKYLLQARRRRLI